MDNREKLDKMDRALRLMEDLKSTQVTMVEKSSKLQMDAMEFSFGEMEKNMGELFSRYHDSLDLINEEIERFETKRSAFESKHGLDKEEEGGE